MAGFRNPFNTLLGRLALLTIGLVVLEHLGARYLVLPEIGRLDADHARRAVELAEYAHDHPGSASDSIVRILNVHFLSASDVVRDGCPGQCAAPAILFDRDLQKVLIPDSLVVSDMSKGKTWVRYGGRGYWMGFDNMVLSNGRLLDSQLLTLLLAIVAAVLGAWQFQRPLHRLADAARRFHSSRETSPVVISGPTELRVLIGDFNAMVEDLSVAERERGVMLAGVAHDLKAPVARMMVRADLLEDESLRAGFVQDAQGMSRIITQFLEYARHDASGSEVVEVDGFCQEYYGEDAQVRLALQAGTGFRLPCVDLQRMLGNLVGNAQHYGKGPIEIMTCRDGGDYLLCVRDHGEGVPEDKLDLMVQPFVRLHAEHHSHSGLGLSIVRKLVLANQGAMRCENAPGGGLLVTLRFGRDRQAAVQGPDAAQDMLRS